MLLSTTILTFCTALVSADLDGETLLQQFYAPRRLLGNSFGNPGVNATYDYVIVGAGLAGSLTASRIADALPNMTVAVVEAGSFYEISNGNYSQIPYYSTMYTGGDPSDYQPLVDWGIFTEPIPAANGRRFLYVQGKALGGSSARNQLIYHRATKGWYAAIANITGDPAYLWENMFPFMKKSFSFTPPDTRYRAENATVNYTLSTFDKPGGPVHLSFPKYAQPISSYGAEGYAKAGIKAAAGFLDGNMLGYGYWPFTLRAEDSTRSSTESAFLSRTTARTSLKIYQSCMARNLLFDENKRAVGINVTVAGTRPFVLKARKEVIVSSGFINSPHLLMVSGIGPRETLERYDIPVISDLSGVGQNLRDTPAIGGVVHTTNVPGRSAFTRDALSFDNAIQGYLANGSGPLSSPASDFVAWEKFSKDFTTNMSQSTLDYLNSIPSDWPNVEYPLQAAVRASTAGQTASDTGVVGILLTSASSKGNVTIQSADNTIAPIVHIGWLDSKEDKEMAVAAYRRARTIAASVSALGDEIAPGANVTTDAQILDYIKTKGMSAIHHGTSTCAMGKKASDGAVVDSKARVFGVKGLRVIDASSLPFQAPGHSQGVTYAHAEKLAQDVIDAGIGM
ncbi:GMC oxidoreductase [Pyrenophora tritici-repentis]|nr:GMC oxidoreductase [Pyrenophora tritici-repentis]KAI0605589.1 GMC oxidoreductase [Pyrenophora tritici-repentis]KAI0619464.1 GMC oxidoreductase [Pyrenophora tritici-repentis]KAI1667125.1 GMC oxidoreductase [Pyrenophora tritici-repentis]KAI2484449.1 GMC oxidoreductase [Pyrenophora tritici-repentis]